MSLPLTRKGPTRFNGRVLLLDFENCVLSLLTSLSWERIFMAQTQKIMLVIGFSTQFYTLWNVNRSIEYGAGETVNGQFNGRVWERTDYRYECNLSMDLDVAREKIAKRAGDQPWSEDLSLKGERWHFTKKEITEFAVYQFTFGRKTGTDMRTCEDAWQLKRAMNAEASNRRRVVARQRLVELGELVRFPHTDQIAIKWDDNDKAIEWKPCRSNWATPKQAEFLTARDRKAAMSGHFFTNGQRVTMEIAQIGAFSFETGFGTTFVREYETTDGKLVKYMGANPLDLEDGEVITVTATIKHDNYKGLNETKLLRIKKVTK